MHVEMATVFHPHRQRMDRDVYRNERGLAEPGIQSPPGVKLQKLDPPPPLPDAPTPKPEEVGVGLLSS